MDYIAPQTYQMMYGTTDLIYTRDTRNWSMTPNAPFADAMLTV